MREFPSFGKYTHQKCDVPGRPWWRLKGVGGQDVYKRSDGMLVWFGDSFSDPPKRCTGLVLYAGDGPPFRQILALSRYPGASNPDADRGSSLKWTLTHEVMPLPSTAARLEALDRLFPLPFPGLFPGQVWLLDAVQTQAVYQLDFTCADALPSPSRPVQSGRHWVRATPLIPVLAFQSFYTLLYVDAWHDLVRSFETGQFHTPDGLCAHLIHCPVTGAHPWSPAKA